MKVKATTILATTLAICPLAFPMLAGAADTKQQLDATYSADLQPMNAALTGYATTGQAEFKIRDDQLTISINVKNAPPNISHWQHFHGLAGTLAASCATPDSDTNKDGVVDLIETEPASGTTMVPFDKMPAAMDVAHGVYPKASEKGAYDYRQVVSVKALAAAFSKAFNGQDLDLDKRVVLIHGVPSDMELPATVKSLGPIPAHVTLPIACGKIVRTHPLMNDAFASE